MAGHVLVNDKVIDKPGFKCEHSSRIRIKYTKKKFVSRSGEKLNSFLNKTEIEIEDKVCLDIGISTGGFTDVLLKNKARHILGVDVAYGLTDFKIRQDKNVSLLERTNARYLKSEEVINELQKSNHSIEDISIVTMDVSFISIFKIIPNLINKFNKDVDYIILIKPQFEAEQYMVEKGGLITNSTYMTEIINNVEAQFETNKLSILYSAPSTLKGTKGNQEYFYHCKLC